MLVFDALENCFINSFLDQSNNTHLFLMSVENLGSSLPKSLHDYPTLS